MGGWKNGRESYSFREEKERFGREWEKTLWIRPHEVADDPIVIDFIFPLSNIEYIKLNINEDGAQASVDAEDLLIDQGCNWESVEDLAALFLFFIFLFFFKIKEERKR